MTPVALYQSFVRLTLFLLGGIFIWIALFFILAWLLRYEPVQIKLLSNSRRGRITSIMISMGSGILTMVIAMNTQFAEYTAAELAICGCMAVLAALLYLSSVRTSAFELRRAVRLRRQRVVGDHQP